MHRSMRGVLAALMSLGMVACSDDGTVGEAADSHVWEEQVETLDKAAEVENVLQEAAAAQAEAIESQTD